MNTKDVVVDSPSPCSRNYCRTESIETAAVAAAVAAAQIYVHGVLIIHNASDTRHRRVDESFSLVQCSPLLCQDENKQYN